MDSIDKAAELFLFTGVSRQIIETAVQDAGCETVSYINGENIFGPEDFQRKLGFVLEGSVRAYGGQVLLNVISTGGVFGAAALFGSNSSYCSRLQAAGSCEIMFFTEALVQKLISGHAVIAVNYVRFLSDRIRFLNHKIATFTADSARSRLLQYLISQLEMQKRPDRTVLLPMSCQKLAEFLNIGRASLYRAFEQLENDGLIRRNGKSVEIDTMIEGV